jgi:predicted RNase H-like HicB family nuclease
MRYSVVLTRIVGEPGLEGWYNAQVPALELTTQGESIEAALAAARELSQVWIQERVARGEPVPSEPGTFFTEIDVPDALQAA